MTIHTNMHTNECCVEDRGGNVLRNQERATCWTNLKINTKHAGESSNLKKRNGSLCLASKHLTPESCYPYFIFIWIQIRCATPDALKSPIPGRGCYGDLPGDEIVVSPPFPIVEPLSRDG